MSNFRDFVFTPIYHVGPLATNFIPADYSAVPNASTDV